MIQITEDYSCPSTTIKLKTKQHEQAKLRRGKILIEGRDVGCNFHKSKFLNIFPFCSPIKLPPVLEPNTNKNQEIYASFPLAKNEPTSVHAILALLKKRLMAKNHWIK